MASKADFKTVISHRSDHTAEINKWDLDKDILGTRAVSEQDRAYKSAFVDDKGGFRGRRSLHDAASLRDELESYKDLQRDLAEFKQEAGANGRGARGMERWSERQKDRLTRTGKKVLKDIDDGYGNHKRAVDALTEQKYKIQEEMRRVFDTEFRTFESMRPLPGIANYETKLAEFTQGRDRLRNNFEAVKDRLDGQFEEAIRPHNEQLKEFDYIIKDVEEATGLKASEVMGSKVVKAAESGLETVAKTSEVVAKEGGILHNLKIGKASAWLGAGAAAILGVDGFRRLMNGLGLGKAKPDGTESNVGDLFIGAGELGGMGLLLTRVVASGGRAH